MKLQSPRAICLLTILVAGNAQPAAEPPDDAAFEELVVVGSRLKRVDAETARAVRVIDAAELARTGQATLAGALQQLSFNGDPLNRASNNGGQGQNLIDLRHLGANRTLVLVDGRRWFHSIDGAIDLNTIPLGLVDRVEILKDGASAIYGSEAIGGVVNVLLKQPQQQEVAAYFGQYEQGDGDSRNLEWSGGWNRGDWSFSGGLSYVRQDKVGAGARAISAVPNFGFGATDTLGGFGASSLTPAGRYGFGPGGNRLPNGSPGTLTFDASSGDYRPFDAGRDGYNFAPETYLLIPLETRALYSRAQFQFVGGTRFSADLLLHQRDSAQRLAATRISTSPTNSNLLERFVVPADHVYNPFNAPVTRLALRLVDLPRAYSQQVDSWRVSAGLDGDLDGGNGSWSWRAYLLHADSRGEQIQDGLVDARRAALALGPSFLASDGRARCGTPQAPISGCVPVDAFRGQQGLTTEMLDYLRFKAFEDSGNQLDMLALDASGEAGSLRGRPIDLALGIELRHESAFRRPDPGLSNGLGESLDPTRAVQGSSQLLEAWAETNLPVLAGRPWAHSLDLSLALRGSHYERFGTTTNPQLGLRWQPHADWLLRAYATEAFRAPSTAEAYGAVASYVAQVFDPCDSTFEPPPEIVARCRAGGVPANYVGDEFGQLPARSGGNDSLGPERARTASLGVVWSPNFGMNVSLDWYRIRLRGAIDRLDPQSILDECYVFGTAAACDLVTREPGTGVVLDVDARLQNLALQELAGVDLQFSQDFNTDVGRFRVLLDASYVDRHDVEPLPGAPTFGLNGILGYWRLKANAELIWQPGPWELSLRFRHFSDFDEPCLVPLVGGRPEMCVDPDQDDPRFGLPVRRVPSVIYTDLSIARTLPWNARVVIGAQNLFDRDPPIAYMSSNSFLPAYDIPGVYWNLRYSQRF